MAMSMNPIPSANATWTVPVGTTNRPVPEGSSENHQISYADINRNGEYDPNIDQVILSDGNGDRSLDYNDAHYTSRMMHQIGDIGQPDLNGDGQVTFDERSEARLTEPKARRRDRNSDGVLSGSREMTTTGRIHVPFVGRSPIPNPLVSSDRYTLARDRNNDGRFAGSDVNRRVSIKRLSEHSITLESNQNGLSGGVRRLTFQQNQPIDVRR